MADVQPAETDSTRRVARKATRCLLLPIRILLYMAVSLTAVTTCACIFLIIAPAAFPHLEGVPVIARSVTLLRWAIIDRLVQLIDYETGLSFFNMHRSTVTIPASDARVVALLSAIAILCSSLTAFWI